MTPTGKVFGNIGQYTAPLWKFWVARILGTKLVSRDGNAKVVIFAWKGVLYFWENDK